MPDTNAWESYRSYLMLLARVQLQGRRDDRFDASDLVQQALLRAVEAKESCRAADAAAQKAWLRKILANTFANAVRDQHRAKRDVSREVSWRQSLDASSVRLEQWLAQESRSPSADLIGQEKIEQLAQALEQLPQAQREAILRRYLAGESMQEIAQGMGKTMPAIAGLLQRGLRQLRRELADKETHHD